MSLAEFFEHPLWSRLAAMHFNFLWQGFLIAWLYWTLVKLFAVESARVRYLLGIIGLAAMLGCNIATFWTAEIPETKSNDVPIAEIDESASHAELPGESLDFTASSDVTADETEAVFTPAISTDRKREHSEIPATNRTQHEPAAIQSQSHWMPILLGGWFLGVMVLGLRLLAGVGTVFWWRWSSLPINDPRWRTVLDRLSKELGLRRCPRLAVSLRARDAFSLGLIRPLIVVPAAWLLQLPADTLESVLAHELAHIRRWDAWANLFQRVLEAWLFYHPAVWWLSRRIEKEREKCCDLWAVSLTGDRLQYVKSLAGLAEFQHANRPANWQSPILASGMGGKNMVLLERVRHILGETPRTGAASRFLAGTMVLAIPAALWVGTMMLPIAADGDDEKIVAQAEGDEDGNRRRGGDRERPEGRRDGERRPEGRRDGDRPRAEGERRDGDRPRREGEREGDRPTREGEREGDRPRGEREREGDRPRPEGERRDGDRPRREGERREGEGRPGFAPRPPLPPRGPREGERPGGFGGFGGFQRGEAGPQAEMMQLLRELRREVEQLRREVQELKAARGETVGPRTRVEEESNPLGLRSEFRRDVETFRRLEGERREEGRAERDDDDGEKGGGAKRDDDDREKGGRAKRDEGDDDDNDGEKGGRAKRDDDDDGEKGGRAKRDDDDYRELLEKAREGREAPEDRDRKVPAVLGLHWKEAGKKLDQVGYKAKYLRGEVAPSADKLYIVYQQSPKAGDYPKAGAEVSLTVYKKAAEFMK